MDNNILFLFIVLLVISDILGIYYYEKQFKEIRIRLYHLEKSDLAKWSILDNKTKEGD